MNKQRIIFAFFGICLILAQTSFAKPKKEDDSSDEEEGSGAESSDADSEEESSDEEDINAEENHSLTCELFGDKGCRVECAIISQAYSFKAHGSCNQEVTCQCNISNDVSFHKHWDRKFDSDYVYKRINNNLGVLEQAERILHNPLKTGTQYKELLQPVLSPYEFSKLTVKDDSFAAKLTKKDKIDQDAVRKYVKEKLEPIMKSYGKSLLTVKYQEKLRNALKDADDKGTLYNLTFRTRFLKNKTLENVLEEYLKKNKIEEPKVEMKNYEGLIPELSNTIINELITQIDEKSKTPTKAATKKPAKTARTRSAKKSS